MRALWGRLRFYGAELMATLWFVPLMMSLAGCALAAALLRIDMFQPPAPFLLLYPGDGRSALQLVSALLTGIITMSSITISITMVVLTLAAAQVGPRLIRNFVSDRVNQVVVGLFIATILYLIVTIHGVNRSGDPEWAPRSAIMVGSILSGASLFVLLFYIHKLARWTNADSVIKSVSTHLLRHIDSALPSEGDAAPPPRAPPGACRITLGESGYIQAIELDELVELASEAGGVFYVEARAGHFVLAENSPLAFVPADRVGGDMVAAARAAFIIGPERTPAQDLEYGIRQLVEIALRALSPGLNDTFTAVTVIDHLSAVLHRIFMRGPEVAITRDRNGAVRLVREVSGYPDFVAVAYDQIRESGEGKPAVLIRVMEALGRLRPVCRNEAQRRAIHEQMEKVWRAGERGIGDPADLADLERRYRMAGGQVRGVAGGGESS